MNNGDNQEYERATRQARQEGLFYLGCIVVASAIGFLLKRWL